LKLPIANGSRLGQNHRECGSPLGAERVSTPATRSLDRPKSARRCRTGFGSVRDGASAATRAGPRETIGLEQGNHEHPERSSMSKTKKSWREKLADDKGFPRVYPIDETKRKRWGEGTFVIPAPREVAELMCRVPKGKLTTIDELRKTLARKHGATIGCPITTGIFAWIASHAAAEAAADGVKRTIPYWRTLKTKGELNPKYPGGLELAKRKLAAEGHRCVQKRSRCFVVGYESKLAALVV
jgi:6-O-methylguanine DNA methyltransferase, DNA binding domain